LKTVTLVDGVEEKGKKQ